MRLVTAMIARNEGGPDRYLRTVLQNVRSWADFRIVLDDGSEDDTAAIAREEGAYVVSREMSEPMWGREAPARAELWDLAAEAAKDFGAWVLFHDADMLLSADPRPLCMTEHLNTWCWPLYDLWDEAHYRADGYWQAHKVPRPWLVNPGRVSKNWTPAWDQRGLHSGHLPINWPEITVAGNAPPQYYWLHLAYATPEHRARKREQYLSRRDQLTDFEIAHASSINDP